MSISVHFTTNSTEVGSLIIAKLLEPLCNLVAPVVLILSQVGKKKNIRFMLLIFKKNIFSSIALKEEMCDD